MYIIHFFVLVNTAPKPDHWALGCYSGIGKTFTRDSFADLEAVLAKYSCDFCPIESTAKVNWPCAALSEILEMHPGYLDFGTSFDMLVSHARFVSRNMEYFAKYTMSNGTVLKNFIVTDNGFLADTDLTKPGTKLFMITGYAKHSSLYKRSEHVDWMGFSWNYPNPKYAGIRAMTFSLALLINPAQERDLLRGKMALDFHPDILSDWCTVFLECWYSFVDSNPCTKVTEIYRTHTDLYYGSPTDHAVSHRLQSYNGLPLLLSYYHNRISSYIRQIVILSKQRLGDKDADVPLGKSEFRYLNLTFA